jgi:hypothetical protein
MYEAFHQAIAEVEKGQLERLSDQQLQSYKEDLRSGPRHGLDAQLRAEIRERIASVDREIQLRRIEEKAERRHQESHGVGKRTLTWARVAGVAAIAAGLIAAAELIHNIFFSKVQHANTETASPPTYRQTPAPNTALPVPEANSNSATPSPQQAPTAQPSATAPPPSPALPEKDSLLNLNPSVHP